VQIIKKNLVFILLFLTVFFTDRISKILVINKVEKIGNNKVYESLFFNFELVWNKGVAFGLFSFGSSNVYNFITIIIFSVILIVSYLAFKEKSVEKVFFTMISAGAIGNFYDRLTFRSVPDFIDIHVNNFHWFIFNIADIFITLGIIGLICKEVLLKKDD
jgi:signal peptidase II